MSTVTNLARGGTRSIQLYPTRRSTSMRGNRPKNQNLQYSNTRATACRAASHYGRFRSPVLMMDAAMRSTKPSQPYKFLLPLGNTAIVRDLDVCACADGI